MRPNSGRVPPGGSVDVAVLLQPMKEDPPLDFKCRDKFLVQAVKISDRLLGMEEGDAVQRELADMWSKAEQKKKADGDWALKNFAERKLRVTFLPAAGATAAAATPNRAPTLTVPDADAQSHLSPGTPPAFASARATAVINAEELEETRKLVEKLQREMADKEKELQGLRQRSGKEATAATALQQQAVKPVKKGFSFTTMLIFALIFFVLGIYLAKRY